MEDDALLWLRQVYLHHRASKAAQPEKVVTALEQPDDPEAYLGETKKEAAENGGQATEGRNEESMRHPRYPTYWSWPEWQTVKLRGLFEVRFDQGPMGHAEENLPDWELTCPGSRNLRVFVDRGMEEKTIGEIRFRRGSQDRSHGQLGHLA